MDLDLIGAPGAKIHSLVQGKQTKKGLGSSWMIATDLLQFLQELRLSRFVWRHFIFLSQKNKSTEHWFSFNVQSGQPVAHAIHAPQLHFQRWLKVIQICC
jgi:hypothetical protein